MYNPHSALIAQVKRHSCSHATVKSLLFLSFHDWSCPNYPGYSYIYNNGHYVINLTIISEILEIYAYQTIKCGKSDIKLPITHYPLPITHYLLPITHYLLPITYYLLPITHYPLPITHYPLPITHYLYPD